PRTPVRLLAEQGVVVGPNLFGHADKEGAGAAGRVTDSIAGLGAQQLSKKRGHLGRRIELPRFLAGASRETADQEFIHIADDVAFRGVRRPELKLWVVEVFEQKLQAAVAFFGLAKGRLGVEIDVAENIFELALVGILDLLQGDVDEFANIRSVALG